MVDATGDAETHDRPRGLAWPPRRPIGGRPPLGAFRRVLIHGALTLFLAGPRVFVGVADAADLEGRTLLKRNYAVVHDAVIRASHTSGSTKKAKSGPTGYYALRGLHAGTHALEVQADTLLYRFEVEVGQTVTQRDLLLDPDEAVNLALPPRRTTGPF